MVFSEGPKIRMGCFGNVIWLALEERGLVFLLLFCVVVAATTNRTTTVAMATITHGARELCMVRNAPTPLLLLVEDDPSKGTEWGGPLLPCKGDDGTAILFVNVRVSINNQCQTATTGSM